MAFITCSCLENILHVYYYLPILELVVGDIVSSWLSDLSVVVPWYVVDALSSCIKSVVGDSVGDSVVLMSQTGQLSNGDGSTVQLYGVGWMSRFHPFADTQQGTGTREYLNVFYKAIWLCDISSSSQSNILKYSVLTNALFLLENISLGILDQHKRIVCLIRCLSHCCKGQFFSNFALLFGFRNIDKVTYLCKFKLYMHTR